MIRFGLKLGMAAGATYFTVEQGVWKDSSTTVCLYENIVQNVRPYVKEINEQSPVKIVDIPAPSDALAVIPTYWNKAVMKSFLFIRALPEYIKSYSSKGYDYLVSNQEIKKVFDTFSGPEDKQQK